MSGRFTEDVALRRPEHFVSCRVGLELQQYDENIAAIMKDFEIGHHGDFIVTPIASPMSAYYDSPDDINLLPDLVIPHKEWENKVAVSINYKPRPTITADGHCDETFKILLSHALYLPTQAIIIDCPECPLSQQIVASVVNEVLGHKSGRPLILFRVQLGTTHEYTEEERRNLGLNRILMKDDNLSPTKSDDTSSEESGFSDSNHSPAFVVSFPNTSTKPSASKLIGFESGVFLDDWARWNSLRQHLIPDSRVGVCLSFRQDLDFEYERLLRWTGEPIRLITLSCDRFVMQANCRGSTRLNGRLKEFIRTIMLANSFMTALIIQAMPNHDMKPYVEYLRYLCASFEKHHPDYLRGWNDNLLTPLQPLSTNLDSRTYQIFELDRIKYLRYQQAMIEALDYIMMRSSSKERTKFSLMVLGAGRGPLVDELIKAIQSLNLTRKKFKIYALDKNHSSVQSLKYKQTHLWSKAKNNIETEVVKADMRYWQPAEKADLIATELLGSLSDNELSPECIDGTWRFSTPDTISIPESYTSYVAPICSFKMHQELNIKQDPNVFDQIYVVRLSNIFTISEPQPLFTFEHLDLSKKPVEGANRRHKRLVFSTPVDTTCHGFAGYFAAKLFGASRISTVPSFKTESMDSWFPAFIPLEKPIQLKANTEMEVVFNRNDNESHVWYEWYVLGPEKSRVHTQENKRGAMSKST